MHAPIDPFDPRFWPSDEDREWRIYGTDDARVHAIVDREDWEYFSRWLWTPKRSRGGEWGKFYLRRAVNRYENGRRVKVDSLYLHIEIMKHSGIKPPTLLHTVVDHRDGDSLNCRRTNLRWVTPQMNRLNLNGCYSHDLIEG